MDTLFHFIFPLIALLAARVKIKHKITTMILLALAASVFIDLDHLFLQTTRALFHNVFVTLLFPIALIILALTYERKGTYYKHITLALLLVMFSHPILDMFTEGGVQFFYPISNNFYDLSKLSLAVEVPAGTGYIISTAGIGLTIYFLMILGVIFIEDFMRVLRKYRIPSKALWKTIEKEEREIKREL